MARSVKVYTDKDGKEVEFYTDTCMSCQKEMVFPKEEVDKIESMFPFVKEKAEKGSSCMECVMKYGKDAPNKVFSPEEIETIKKTILQKLKK